MPMADLNAAGPLSSETPIKDFNVIPMADLNMAGPSSSEIPITIPTKTRWRGPKSKYDDEEDSEIEARTI